MNPYALRLYVLDQDGMPRRVADPLKWADWHGKADRHLGDTEIFPPGGGTVRVSTVFLGIDSRIFGEGPPILWETMVFGGPHDRAQRRYSSQQDALAGHNEAVAAQQQPATTEKS